MPQLEAILSLASDGDTIADLQALAAETARFGLSDDLELFDGICAGTLVEGIAGTGYPAAPYTLGAFREWVGRVGQLVAPTARVEVGDLVVVDIPAAAIETAVCSEHVGVEPAIVVVSIDPMCAGHGV